MSVSSVSRPKTHRGAQIRRLVGVMIASLLVVAITCGVYCKTQKVCVVIVEVPALGPDEIVRFRLERESNGERELGEQFIFDAPGRYEIRTPPGQYTAYYHRRPREYWGCFQGYFEHFRLLPLQSKMFDSTMINSSR